MGVGLLALGLHGAASGATEPAASTAVAVDATPSQDLDAELARARALLARLQRNEDDALSPLLDQQRTLAARWVLLLELAKKRRGVSEPSPSAPGAAPDIAVRLGPPPHEVAELDALRDELDGLLAQRRSLEASSRGLETRIAALLAARRKSEENLRLLDEQLARARDADSQGRIRAEADVQRLEARISALEIALAEAERTAVLQRAAALAASAEPLERETTRARWRQQIDDATMAQVHEAAQAAQAALAQQRRTLVTLLARREQALAAATNPADADARQVAALRGRISALDELEGIENGRIEAWRQRRAALEAGDDRDLQAQARATLLRSIQQLDARAQVAEERRELVLAGLRTRRLRQEGLEALGGVAEARLERAALEAIQQEADTLETVRERLRRLQRLLQRSLDDLEARIGAHADPWTVRLWEGLGSAVEAVWRYELFSVSESTQVDGRSVTLEYGVTVGKSLGVVVLFVLGWFVASALSRSVIGLMVRRLQLTPQFGRVLHRWVLSLLLLGVLVVVLKLARIPLTAFAFLGGALAIGVGFGTQNVIKNLISGVIILFERKVRVGDIVTIDGVSGTVSSVDLRATTVRGFDGIEAIVPNSQLLENRVSNWSYGSPTIRRTIVVGLRYGQDARLASEAIRACALADAAVLPDPAPIVLFDDFGADAQVLRLLFWIHLKGLRSGPEVDSDLRHAISAAFAAHDLQIAFPQRDVHLALDAPVEVHVGGAR